MIHQKNKTPFIDVDMLMSESESETLAAFKTKVQGKINDMRIQLAKTTAQLNREQKELESFKKALKEVKTFEDVVTFQRFPGMCC